MSGQLLRDELFLSRLEADRLRAELAATKHALRVILFAAGIDGLLHEPPCECHWCQAVEGGNAALQQPASEGSK